MEEEKTPTSIALSVFLWRQQREGRTGGGVAMGTDRAALCECVCVHLTLLRERLGSARGLLKLAVFLGTLPLDGLRVRDRERGGVRDGQVKDRRQGGSRGIII